MRKLGLVMTVSALALFGCGKDANAPNKASSKSYLTAAPGPGKLTPEILHSNPSLDGPTLKSPAMSPDGSMITVLQGRDDDAAQQDLWAYDLANGEGRLLVSSTDLLGAPEDLSDEEKNRRERAREYGKGIVSYAWAGNDQLIFPLGGDVFVYDLTTKKSQQVTATKGFETDAKVSASGGYVAYVRENNLFTTQLSTGLERQLTDGATDLIRNATASFVVQEELARSTGYWWAPDEARLAYTQIDERAIAVENRIEFSANDVRNVSQRYPFAGTANATVRLGVVAREGGETVWADLGTDPDVYLTRVAWSADSKTVYVGLLSRNHKSHKIFAINSDTGESRVIFEDMSATWLNIRSAFKSLKSGGLLFSSEQSDLRQIFTLKDNGVLTAVTPNDMRVNTINCVNENTGKVYFTGWKDSALQSHIFSVDMNGENLNKLSTGEGLHSARFAGNCSRYVGTFSSVSHPPQTRAFDNEGAPLAWLNENVLDDAHPYAPYKAAHIMPEFGQVAADDGTPMDYMLFKPQGLKAGEKRPAVTIVYGGPGVQRVMKGWEKKAFARMLAHHGFVVFMMDNRGAANRGKAFEDHLYRSMGQTEVADQTAGAKWLAAQDFVDKDRMGIFGWSYGGYMTLHMLSQTDLYRSGASGAPVTDWALYDTAYTERYLGNPNPSDANYTKGAYEEASVFAHIDGLTEPFLLIHGMADDNVVFRHSIKLMDAMQKRGAYNMRVMTYPGEKHGFRKTENKIHRDRLVLEYFLDTLGE